MSSRETLSEEQDVPRHESRAVGEAPPVARSRPSSAAHSHSHDDSTRPSSAALSHGLTTTRPSTAERNRSMSSLQWVTGTDDHGTSATGYHPRGRERPASRNSKEDADLGIHHDDDDDDEGASVERAFVQYAARHHNNQSQERGAAGRRQVHAEATAIASRSDLPVNVDDVRHQLQLQQQAQRKIRPSTAGSYRRQGPFPPQQRSQEDAPPLAPPGSTALHDDVLHSTTHREGAEDEEDAISLLQRRSLSRQSSEGPQDARHPVELPFAKPNGSPTRTDIMAEQDAAIDAALGVSGNGAQAPFTTALEAMRPHSAMTVKTNDALSSLDPQMANRVVAAEKNIEKEVSVLQQRQQQQKVKRRKSTEGLPPRSPSPGPRSASNSHASADQSIMGGSQHQPHERSTNDDEDRDGFPIPGLLPMASSFREYTGKFAGGSTETPPQAAVDVGAFEPPPFAPSPSLGYAQANSSDREQQTKNPGARTARRSQSGEKAGRTSSTTTSTGPRGTSTTKRKVNPSYDRQSATQRLSQQRTGRPSTARQPPARVLGRPPRSPTPPPLVEVPTASATDKPPPLAPSPPPSLRAKPQAGAQPPSPTGGRRRSSIGLRRGRRRSSQLSTSPPQSTSRRPSSAAFLRSSSITSLFSSSQPLSLSSRIGSPISASSASRSTTPRMTPAAPKRKESVRIGFRDAIKHREAAAAASARATMNSRLEAQRETELRAVCNAIGTWYRTAIAFREARIVAQKRRQELRELRAAAMQRRRSRREIALGRFRDAALRVIHMAKDPQLRQRVCRLQALARGFLERRCRRKSDVLRREGRAMTSDVKKGERVRYAALVIQTAYRQYAASQRTRMGPFLQSTRLHKVCLIQNAYRGHRYGVERAVLKGEVDAWLELCAKRIQRAWKAFCRYRQSRIEAFLAKNNLPGSRTPVTKRVHL